MPSPSSRSRLLITGASGYLGHRLVPLAKQRADVLAVSRKAPHTEEGVEWLQADLTNDLQGLFEQYRPDAIIHAAAINPGVDDDNIGTNETMSARVAEAAKAIGSRLVLVSSDMVYAGSSRAYADDARPDPINAYGESKAAAEATALAAHDNVVCVRTSLIYGLEQIDRGTASFIARLERGERQSLFDNVYRQPIWIDALAEGLLKLALDLDAQGTLNLAGEESISRSEFAKAMLRYWGHAPENIDEGPAPANRGIPLRIDLQLDRAKSLGLATPGVTEILARYSPKS
ncbi:SDR family oxidoreductase [Granulosicoccus antarcticus]|uniref:dTDP-4-dehydrorhamnose reductase n=1 Tax=Granulosicoccus antarcticus IMCC3135 TaxID=1192854 RepID=A0A2Z2NNI8_9GAMM|nr:sugar nucleotide-binding protein [Granulosicoccus antarcticus]ASJ72793.1 dTDP-4-dehydrorhamnose reductase [Granulosicoccus antarcticus IMCC3135]